MYKLPLNEIAHKKKTKIGRVRVEASNEKANRGGPVTFFFSFVLIDKVYINHQKPFRGGTS
jgi:hypothetical protein